MVSGTATVRAGAAGMWRAAGLAAVLVAFFLRLYDISGPSLRGDEAFTVTFARQDVAAMVPTLLAIETQPPLYYSGMHYWMLLTGQSELALRFSALLAGVVLVALLFRLGVATTGSARCGALAALLAAFNPFLIWHAQDARMYSLYATACTLLLLAALGIWRRQAAGQLVGTVQWAAYALAALLGLYVHYWTIFALAGLNAGWLAWLWLQARQGRSPGRTAVWSWLLAQAFVGALYIPWLVQAAPLLIDHAKPFIQPVGLFDVLQRTTVAFSVGLTAGQCADPFTVAFVAVALLGIVGRARGSLSTTVAVLVFLLLPQIGAYALSQVRPVYVERYIMGIAGAYVVCVAWGLWSLWSWARQPAAPGPRADGGSRPARAARRMLALAATLLLIGMSCYSLYNYYFVAEYRKSPGWREAAQYILAQAKPGDLVIENVPDPSLTYYLDDKMDLSVQPSAAPVDLVRLDRDLRLLAATHRRAWFMPDDNPDWDGQGAVLAWLDRNAARLSEAGPGGMTVMLYELTRP